MCGIAGIWNYDGRPVDRGVAAAMCDAIRHRGPDDWGVHLDGGVALGNRRLSIIDIEGGHQPIGNENGNVWIVYNGELYNYRQLRADLERVGYRFRTRSDTEVVLAAYEMWGTDSVRHFNGIFAFTIWDSPRQRLFLARDHLGVKPLYYYSDDERFVFGSEIKAILSADGIPRRLDLEALDLFLTYRYVPSPRTLLRGVHKVPPAHRIVVADGAVQCDCYWDYVPRVIERSDEEGLAAELASRFEQAVARQMVSDVPVGLMLSGGIDSGAVLAVMSKYASNPVQTFTVGFSGDDAANELAEARETARLFGADHHEVVVEAADYRDFLPRVLWHLEEPLSTTSILPFFHVSELAAHHVKVVLTGQGADEPFAGYDRYRGEKFGRYLRRFPAPVQHGLSRAALRLPLRSEQVRRAARALPVEDPLARFVEVYAVFPGQERKRLYRPEVSASLANHDPRGAIAALQKRVCHLDSLEQMLYIDTRVWLPDDLLLYGDKLSMAHSLEARVPFLDVEFLEFAETIPASLKLRGLTGKYIHKKAMEKWLPAAIIRRKKKGFATPMDRWLQSDLASFVRETLLGADSALTEYFDPGVVGEMLDRHVAGAVSYQRQLFGLLVLELWYRIFIRSE